MSSALLKNISKIGSNLGTITKKVSEGAKQMDKVVTPSVKAIAKQTLTQASELKSSEAKTTESPSTPSETIPTEVTPIAEKPAIVDKSVEVPKIKSIQELLELPEIKPVNDVIKMIMPRILALIKQATVSPMGLDTKDTLKLYTRLIVFSIKNPKIFAIISKIPPLTPLSALDVLVAVANKLYISNPEIKTFVDGIETEIEQIKSIKDVIDLLDRLFKKLLTPVQFQDLLNKLYTTVIEAKQFAQRAKALTTGAKALWNVSQQLIKATAKGGSLTEEEIYEIKYLKYKQKYLELKVSMEDE